MAKQFGTYNPVVQLGVTWDEALTLTDPDGTAVDLTGLKVRAQLRAEYPARDGASSTPAPVLEVTTAGYYGTAPSWTVLEGFTVATPANGTITLKVNVDDLWVLSPTNAKTKYRWSVVLDGGVGNTVPVVSGIVSVLPAVTL
jgi:hypothetical protein